MISFPPEIYKQESAGDSNPAIRLFGRRFSDDQQTMDTLAEFLLVCASDKKIYKDPFSTFFPNEETLRDWRTKSAGLSYFPKARLNLKLFAFLESSRLDTRHRSHRNHAEQLWKKLSDGLDLDTPSEKNAFLKTLSALFLGFWGNGASRTWCAQTFLPFCRELLCGEEIWNATKARSDDPADWDEVLDNFSDFFDGSKHIVLARSGESLYLQICNALTQTKDEVVEEILSRPGISLSTSEATPSLLKENLTKALASFFDATPKSLSDIIRFVDTSTDERTWKKSDYSGERPRSVSCGWIPQKSWTEGYLFAVEMKRLLSANIGIIDKLELLEVECTLQVLRSLASQTYRETLTTGGSPDGSDYRILLCDTGSKKRKLKAYSEQSLSEISREIQQVIRKPDELEKVWVDSANDQNPAKKFRKIYTDADKYAYKLFRKLGKSIGLIVPPRGGTMRFTLNEKILRCLVISLVPGRRMTLETFKAQMKAHHGFVFDIKGLAESRNWAGRIDELVGEESGDTWLERMLEASGMLVRLSDACSLVRNPFAPEERTVR